MRALAPLPRAVAATAAASAAASPRAFPGGFLHSFSFPRGSSANPPLRLSDGRRAERNSGAGGRRTTVMASESAAAGNGSAAAYADVLAAAESAVRLACALCETVQRGLKAEESASKSDESPVTIADYGSQVLVAWALQQHGLPGAFSMVAEEDSTQLTAPEGQGMLQRITALVNATIAASTKWGGGAAAPLSEAEVVALIDAGGAEGGKSGRHWVLDPIDGTRGFMRGDQYAVALGLLDQGDVVVGVLGCPNLPCASIAHGVEAAVTTGQPVGCVFSAVKGRGTTVQPLHEAVPPRQVQVSSESNPAMATFCESYESRHSKHNLTASIAQALGVVAPPVRIDSQAKYGAMARGDAAIYMRFPPDGYREKIWDHAAGSLVISEAGGQVCDASGQPLDFSRGRFLDLDTGIIATNATLMHVLLSTVQSALNR